MNNMSDETKSLMEEYMSQHGLTIILYVCSQLQKDGCKISAPDNDFKSLWDASIKITKKDKDGEDIISEMYFYNTFVEIFCVDRDDDPLVFDPEILEDEKYIFGKIDAVLECRLTLILGMLNGKTAEEIYEKNPGMFERIKITKKDGEE